MNFLKTINKLIEGILWLYLPFVLIFWALSPIDFALIKGLRALLSVFIQPLITVLENNFEFSYSFEGSDITYTPLVLAGLVMLAIVSTIINAKTLDFIDNNILKFRMKMTQQAILSEKEKKQQSFNEELEKNKVIYVMLKILKTQRHDEYLVKNDDSAFSVGLIDSYQTSIVKLAEKFSGKEYKNFDAGADTYSFVFADVESFLQYFKVLRKRVTEINKGTADLNSVFNYKIACSCSYSLVTADTDLSITHKLLNLCAESEILITQTLKDKINLYNNSFKLKVEPKGLYMLNEHQVDVHRLNVL